MKLSSYGEKDNTLCLSTLRPRSLMVPVRPLLVKDFAHILNRHQIRCDSKIAVALSGGPDSVALLALLNELRRSRLASVGVDRTMEIHALTIDHGFRKESSEEANEVKRIASDLGRWLLSDF